MRFWRETAVLAFAWSLVIGEHASGQVMPATNKRQSPRDLLIQIVNEAEKNNPAEAPTSLMKACQSFSVYLTRNRGLWGSGPFETAQCEIQQDTNQSISDEKSKKADSNNWRWILKVEASASRKRFEIFFKAKDQSLHSQGFYDLETEINLQTLLEKGDFAQLIAAYLANSLPMRTVLPGARIVSGESMTLAGRGTSSLAPISSSLQIYTLRRTGNIWLTSLIANADLTSQSANKTVISIKNLAINPIDEKPFLKKNMIYYAHQPGEKEANAKKIDDLLRQRLGGFFSKFINIGRSAYVGLRYGVPMQKGTGVLANVKMIGLFGEFRGGMLSGLKLNYDVIPTQKFSTIDRNDEFTWSRFQIGYGVGIRFENPVINWIDFSPKIGVTNLVLRSTPTEDAVTDGYEFKLERAPTVGFEIGLEKRTNAFLLRLWGYGSYSLGVLPIDKQYKSTTMRGGLDIYRELINGRSLKMAVLIFSAIDSNQYTRIISYEELANNPNTTTEVKYGSLLAGGGLTLTW